MIRLEEQAIFKTAPLGFNRQEVLAYIEKLQQHVKNARAETAEQAKGETERMKKLEEERDDLQNQLNARTERVAEVEGALLDLKRQLDAVNSQLADRERRCGILSEQVETFRKRIHTLTEEAEAQRQSAEEQQKTAEAQLADQKHRCDLLSEQVETFRQRIYTLTEEAEAQRQLAEEPQKVVSEEPVQPAPQPVQPDRTEEMEEALAELRQQLAAAEREKAQLADRIRLNEEKARRYDEASATIAQAIVEAQKGAQAITTNAQREADEMTGRAGREARAILEHAKRTAEANRAETARQLQKTLEGIADFHREFEALCGQTQEALRGMDAQLSRVGSLSDALLGSAGQLHGLASDPHAGDAAEKSVSVEETAPKDHRFLY